MSESHSNPPPRYQLSSTHFAQPSLSFSKLKIDSLAGISREALITQLGNIHGKSSSRTITHDESLFLNKWKEILPADRWGAFLLSWSRALASYGTKLSFLNDTSYSNTSFRICGKFYPSFTTNGGNYHKRAELMKTQSAYIPKFGIERYDLNLKTSECLLCQNVAQSLDSAMHATGNETNTILDIDKFLLLPNRYPGHPGGSLFLRKNHDHSESHAELLNYENLSALLEISDLLELTAVRNHQRDGMSIPQHDHAHLFPSDLIPSDLTQTIIGASSSATNSTGVIIPSGTPFATLAIIGPSSSEIAKMAAPILTRLNAANEVFTFTYHKRHLFISPRKNISNANTQISLGGGVPLHLFDPANVAHQDQLGQHAALKGEFPWGRFLE